MTVLGCIVVVLGSEVVGPQVDDGRLSAAWSVQNTRDLEGKSDDMGTPVVTTGLARLLTIVCAHETSGRRKGERLGLLTRTLTSRLALAVFTYAHERSRMRSGGSPLSLR